MIEAIFFDFNGVIIDDEPLQMKAYQEVFVPYGVPLSEAQYYDALGMDDRAFVQAAFERVGKTLTLETRQAVSEAKLLIHRKLMTDELPLFPGVVTFLKAAARSFTLGLVSMASSEEIRYVFDRARLEPLFSVIVSAEDVKVCKPAPDCYQRALNDLNDKRLNNRLLPVLPAECLVVEDSPPGIQSGRAAGMRTLGVTNTVSEAQLRAVGAEVVTPSLADWNVDAVRHLFS
jgi:HAD superfamily hydrolase (TIGR01509 family)